MFDFCVPKATQKLQWDVSTKLFLIKVQCVLRALKSSGQELYSPCSWEWLRLTPWSTLPKMQPLPGEVCPQWLITQGYQGLSSSPVSAQMSQRQSSLWDWLRPLLLLHWSPTFPSVQSCSFHSQMGVNPRSTQLPPHSFQTAEIRLNVTKAHGFCPKRGHKRVRTPSFLEQSLGHAQRIWVLVAGKPLCVYPILDLPYRCPSLTHHSEGWHFEQTDGYSENNIWTMLILLLNGGSIDWSLCLGIFKFPPYFN